jgi:hypothetical protein
VIAPALGQMRVFRQDDKRFCGRTLVVATVTPTQIKVDCFAEFGRMAIEADPPLFGTFSDLRPRAAHETTGAGKAGCHT